MSLPCLRNLDMRGLGDGIVDANRYQLHEPGQGLRKAGEGLKYAGEISLSMRILTRGFVKKRKKKVDYPHVDK